MRTYITITALATALFVIALFSCKSAEIVQVDTSIKYLALGDSYTISHGVEEPLRWPNQLSRKLEADGYEVEATRIIAKTGWKTSDLLNAMSEEKLESYNLVSLLIGVNNQYRAQSFDIFEREFDLLLQKSINIAGGKERVFVVSIPDYGVTPFGLKNKEGIARDIDKYNLYIKERCNTEQVEFVDITEISRQLGDAADALVDDGLHPSGAQYSKWVEAVLPVVKGILSK